jgi:ubiquinone/menaquinone biosynthesis C-methylase UbiE
MSGVGATQSFYTRWARLYDALAVDAPGVSRLRSRAVEALAPTPGDVVVDMGCGTGANFPYLREAVGPAGTVVGVDFTPGVLARARSHVRRAGWDNVHVVRGDATRLPVESADAVFASFVSGMLSNPAAAVADWTDLVGPGGRVGLLDLARSTTPPGRLLNPLFRVAVRATSPPGTRERLDVSPARTLDARVAAAHRFLLEATRGPTHESLALGFARLSAGRVPG